MGATDRPDFVSKQVLKSDYLFVDLSPSDVEPVVLVCAGRELCAPDFFLQRSGFHYHAIELIVSGKWQLSCGGVVHELGPGSLFAYSPSTVFSLRSCSQEAAEKYFIDFAGSEAAQLLERAGLVAGEPIDVVPYVGVRALFEQILDAARYPLARAREMGELLTRLVLLRIEQDRRLPSTSARNSQQTYLRCREYIQEHFIQLRTVEEISAACHLDRAYLSRLFKRHAGESPYQLLTRMKMDYSAERLRSQRIPVKVVALEVGYEDPLHFSRVFKKCFGLSPKHYANRNF